MKHVTKVKRSVREELRLALITTVIVAIAWHLSTLMGYNKYLYSGKSNEPALPEKCLLVEDARGKHLPQIGEYWSFMYFAVDDAGNPTQGTEVLVKQVIGLPGDTVEFRDHCQQGNWQTVMYRNGVAEVMEQQWAWGGTDPRRPREPIRVARGRVLLFPRNREFIEGVYDVGEAELRGKIVSHIP
jgi:hypothetical protein